MGLGQVLKSFRDREVEFPVYDRNSDADASRMERIAFERRVN